MARKANILLLRKVDSANGLVLRHLIAWLLLLVIVNKDLLLG